MSEPIYHPPGSAAARSYGCTCNPRKNCEGAGAGKNGRGEPLYIIAPRCPMHGQKKGAA